MHPERRDVELRRYERAAIEAVINNFAMTQEQRNAMFRWRNEHFPKIKCLVPNIVDVPSECAQIRCELPAYATDIFKILIRYGKVIDNNGSKEWGDWAPLLGNRDISAWLSQEMLDAIRIVTKNPMIESR